MKTTTFLLLSLLISLFSLAQEKTTIYDPNMDAEAAIANAISKAKKQDKQVLLMLGGNWCPWCIKFHHFIHQTPALDSLINSDYELVLINYNRRDKNMELLEQLGFPQRFGFPVFVILDSEGNRLHIQNSAYLEEGKGYNIATVTSFLLNWNKKATERESYIQ